MRGSPAGGIDSSASSSRRVERDQRACSALLLRLDGLWRDEDFAGWSPLDGRPGITPAQLAAVRVLQFLLGLPDAQAAEAVRCRIDFTYALAMEPGPSWGLFHSFLSGVQVFPMTRPPDRGTAVTKSASLEAPRRHDLLTSSGDAT
ncbi:transposase [Streptomyces sp. NBC_01537]|uniref:transposase n=1 Tax=Streptomyces sp. NBC_01537 TaxID=2903896 RepID=UPI00386F4E68